MSRRAEDDDGAVLSCGVLVPVFRLVPLDLVSVVGTCRAWRDVVCGDAHLSGVLRLVRAWRRFPEAVLGVSRQEISANNWPVSPPLRWLLDEDSVSRASATLGSFTTQVEAYHERLVRDGREEGAGGRGARGLEGISLDAQAGDHAGRGQREGCGRSAPVGSSKWHGLPDFPVAKADWLKRNKDRVSMLLQLKCRDVARLDCFGVIPDHGLLQFWFSVDGPGGNTYCPVVWHQDDDPSQLVSTPYPEGAYGPCGEEAPLTLGLVLMPQSGFMRLLHRQFPPPVAKFSDILNDLGYQGPPDSWLFGSIHSTSTDVWLQPGQVLLCHFFMEFRSFSDSVSWWITDSDLAARRWDKAEFSVPGD